MVFTTPYFKKQAAEPSGLLGRGRVLEYTCWLSVAVLLLMLHMTPASAQPVTAVAHLGVERDSTGVYVDASLEFDLPALVEAALQQGIAVTFITEAEVFRKRWYWFDRAEAHAKRYSRLSYQPLTRRWRLSVSSSPFQDTGLGVSMGQTYEQRSDVLAALQRVSRWNVADASELNAQQPYRLNFSFQLDISQLPRPLQIGALGRSDWSLSMSRVEPVPALEYP